MRHHHRLCMAAVVILPALVLGGGRPTREDVVEALRKAVQFFHSEVAIHGGYVWRYSADLKCRQGEGLAYDQKIWVQPPGTPAVGLAFLGAYEATGDPLHLKAACDAAHALVKGQLHSGGWHYYITFDPRDRQKINYRQPPSRGKPSVQVDPTSPGGWTLWRRRQHKGNTTIVDDDATPSALRLLARVDQALGFKDKQIHEAAEYGLASLIKAQYPVGAWSHNYDRFPRRPPDSRYYPVEQASFPASWSRRWTKKFSGCYMINDRITTNVTATMLDAYAIYGKKEYLACARRGGDFLLRAQMPDPQPAWAQQYDRHMQPVWDRPFEPPAITGFESQDVLETLLLLYERTRGKKYLEAADKGLAYLRRSLLEDGKLARFYELKTNRPLYFTKRYQITYDRGQMPSHYQFVVDSRLDAIAPRLRSLAGEGADADASALSRDELAKQVERIIKSMNSRGAWLEPGWVRNAQGKKVVPANGIILSETFIKNVGVLSRFAAIGAR